MDRMTFKHVDQCIDTEKASAPGGVDAFFVMQDSNYSSRDDVKIIMYLISSSSEISAAAT